MSSPEAKKPKLALDVSSYYYIEQDEKHDRILLVEKTKFYVQSKKLIEHSDYFRVMFSSDFMESNKEIVEIKAFDSKKIKIFLDALYKPNEFGITVFLTRLMSSVTPAAKGSKEDDILWNLVKNNEFLKFEHSIEQIKPSRLDFPVVTKRMENDTTFSNVGLEVIKNYLHIGLVNADSTNGQIKRSRVLLLVWPKFVSPECYQKHKLYFADLKNIKTMVFRVPEDVFQKYSEGNNALHEIVAATAILTPVEEWKFLERAVISSFYHLTFDKATSDLHGNINVWQNYSKDDLDKEWKQLLYICCGPQGLAYLFKRMLNRNWARIVRNSVSHVACDGYSAFCIGGITKLVVEWAKLFFKPDGVVKFLEEINTIKPVLSTKEVVNKANSSFDENMYSAKKYRCNVCPFGSNKKYNFDDHMRTHTGETPFVCDICGSAYKLGKALTHHKIIHHTGNYPYHCKFCGKPFVESNYVKFHLTVHERKGDVHFQCYKCSHIAKDETRLMEHMDSHSKDPSFRCTECGRKCDSESALLAHSRNHIKDKPFCCHICKKGFLLESTLRRHYVTHSDSRPVFTCHVCNRNLATSHSLRTHMAAQHGEKE